MLGHSDAATRTQGQEVLKQVLPRAKIEETRILCYQQLAIAYYLADQYNESVEVLKRALAEFPDDWELNNNLAFTLATHLGRAKDALEPAERAAAIRPTNVDSLDTLGAVYLLAGDLDKAEQVLRKAVVAGGRLIGQTSAMIHLCKTMLAKKDIPAARKIFDDLNQLAKSVSSEMPADQKKELEAIRTQLDSPQNR